MKYWIARTLGGALCTLSLVALGTGGAYAAPHAADGGIDIDLGGVKVKVGGHKDDDNKSSSSKNLVKVRVKTPVTPRVQARVGSGSGSTLRVGAKVGSSSQSHRSASSSSAVRKAAEQKAEARKVAAKKVAAKKAAVKKAHLKKVADTRARIGAVATVQALPNVLPSADVRAKVTVASIPIRACVEVNAAGCSRYVYSGAPSGSSIGENGGGGYKTVHPAVLPSAVVTAAAEVPVVGTVNACILVSSPACSARSGSGSGSGSAAGNGVARSLPVVVPPILVLADAKVLSIPVRACVEVNASGCSRYVYSGAPAANPGTENGGGGFAAMLPSVIAEATASLPVVGQANACVLVNTLGCSTGTGTGNGPGTGTGTAPVTSGLLPVVIGTADADLPVVGQVNACVLVNAPGCQGTGTGTGTTPGGGIVPPIVGEVVGQVPGVGTVEACVLVNAPGCTDGGTTPVGDPTTPANPGDLGDPGTGSAPGVGGGNTVSGDTAPLSADIGGQAGGAGDRSLAHTGGSVGSIVALAAGVLLLTGAALVLRKRRTRVRQG